MTFADHFSAVAARYAAYRPRYPAALVELLADRAPARELAWDAGCGSGQLSVALAARFERVVATDPARAQIEAAERHARVEYRCEPAEASTLPDRSAALIVAAQAAHWFDWPRFVAEAGRVAAPGGLVALVSYGNLVLAGEAGPIVEHYQHGVAGPYWPPGRRHVENGYAELGMPWPAVEAPPIEMTASWSRDEVLGYVSSWSATARLIEQVGAGPFEALGAALAAVWPDNEPRTVRWPLTIRLARP